MLKIPTGTFSKIDISVIKNNLANEIKKSQENNMKQSYLFNRQL